jgi:hypothetical protein
MAKGTDVVSRHEVKTALAKERVDPSKPTVLFPVRLDEPMMLAPAGWAALLRNTRHPWVPCLYLRAKWN